MKIALRVVLLVVLLGAFSVAALAQMISGSTSSGPNGFTARITIQPQRVMAPAVAGAPYSAEQVSEHIQTLADGTHIRQNQQVEHLYRDSAGRTRTERPFFMGPNGPQQDLPLLVQIFDPLTGSQYVLDPDNHIAHRFTIEPRPVPMFKPPAAGSGETARRTTATSAVTVGGGMGAVSGGGVGVGTAGLATATTRSRMEPPKREQLGTQMIEGVMAEGTRWTTVFPEGTVGNDRAFSTVSETWMSTELKTQILSKNDDPRSGENVVRLIHINRADPDASLFMPPPDYRIVDATETVTITIKRP
jgi:hypothetical protein